MITVVAAASSSSLVNHKYPRLPPNTTRFFARLGVSCVKVCASAGLARGPH